MLWPGLAAAEPVADALRAALADAHTLAGEALYAPELMQFLYAGRDFAPLWPQQGPGDGAQAARQAIAAADAHGLRPADYHLAAIDALHADATPTGRATRELLLCDGLLMLGSHVRSGKVQIGAYTPRRNLLAVDADLPARLVGAATPVQFVSDLASSLAGYPRLQQALARYRALAGQGNWPLLPDGPTLRPDQRADAVLVLRERLLREGVDGAASVASNAASDPASNPAGTLFDAPLQAAVRRFQARHGLDVDGAVGRQTRRALAVPVDTRVAQLVANLERRRWLGASPGRQQVRVNVAAFSLEAIDGDAVALRMRVVVGQPYRATPEFSDRIRYLVLNPYWEVPPRLAQQDKLPLIRADVAYLERQHLRVLKGWGEDAQQIDPASVDWQRVATPLPYRLRQDPGPWNALGRVKFMFPNAHNVYLHDSPARELFAHAERSFSSGCIRLEDPLALADWLLAQHPRWSPATLRAALDQGEMPTVHLREPVPVHLLYWTAWVGSDDAVHFRRDIYQRDGRLAAALATPLTAQ